MKYLFAKIRIVVLVCTYEKNPDRILGSASLLWTAELYMNETVLYIINVSTNIFIHKVLYPINKFLARRKRLQT